MHPGIFGWPQCLPQYSGSLDLLFENPAYDPIFQNPNVWSLREYLVTQEGRSLFPHGSFSLELTSSCFLWTGHVLPCCYCCLAVKSYLTLFDPMDRSLPCSPVHEISQARISDWVPIFFSRGSSWPRNRTRVSCIGRQILYQGVTREALVFLSLVQPAPLLVITWLSTAEICVWAPRFKWCWCEERSDFTVKPIIILPWGFLTSAFLIFWTKKTHSFLGCSMYSSTFRSILGLYPVDASNTISFPSCKDQRCLIAKYLPGSKIIPSWELGLWNTLLRLKPFLK